MRVLHVGGGELMRGDCVGEHRFPRHHHDEYVIGLVTRGREFITSRGLTHALSCGAIYFNNPAEVHDGRAADEGGWAFLSYYIPPSRMSQLALCDEPLFPQFMLEPGNEAQRAGAALAVLGSSRCTLEIDSALTALLDVAFPRREFTGIKRRARGPKLQRVRDYLDEHYADDIALEDLAKLAGLRRRRLIAAFKDFAGITPHAYLTARRVNAACEAIRNGAPIAEAAATCGFYDQSHLHRHFKRMMGLTPDALARAYQQRAG